MNLTLQNFKESLPPALLLKARKCTVRECDEKGKGIYEAYVDEKSESYDVSIEVSPKGALASHRCDCGSNDPFCVHKTALLLAVGGAAPLKGATPKLKPVKRSKLALLLDDVDTAALKAWVETLLEKNSDLALAFTQRFAEKKAAYTAAEAETLTADAVKSVVKNRRKVEQSELKRIVEIWTDVHQPIVAAYLAGVADEAAFTPFHALLDACLLYIEKLATTSTKIPAYVNAVLDRAVESIATLFSEDAFEAAAGFYLQRIPEEGNGVRLHYLSHLLKVASVVSPERRSALLDQLVAQYKKLLTPRLESGAGYTKLLFGYVQQGGFLPQYVEAFKPVRYDAAFNTLLLNELLANGKWDVAEKYAKEEIAANTREEYSLPYLQVLKEVYRQNGDEASLTEVTKQIFPFSFDFDDFLYVYDRMPEGEDKKKWRTKMFTKARNSYGHRQVAILFCFRLLHHEQACKKMIGLINSYTPYPLILAYFEPMAHADKKELLRVILHKSDEFYGGGRHMEDEQKIFPDLMAAMLKFYDRATLKASIKSLDTMRYYFRRTSFLEYMKTALGVEK